MTLRNGRGIIDGVRVVVHRRDRQTHRGRSGLEVGGAVGGAVVADRIGEARRAVVVGGGMVHDVIVARICRGAVVVERHRPVRVRGRADADDGETLSALVGRAGQVIAQQARGRDVRVGVFGGAAAAVGIGGRRVVHFRDGDVHGRDVAV